MNKILSVVGISLLSAAVLPLMAQEGRPFSQIMKEVNGSVGEVKKAFEDGNKDAVAGAARSWRRSSRRSRYSSPKRAPPTPSSSRRMYKWPQRSC